MADCALTALGYAWARKALSTADCEQIAAHCEAAPSPSAGSRCLLAQAWCVALAGQLRRHAALFTLIPADYVATQCTYFEKSAAQKWLVPIHQDLSIAVAERVSDPALSGWSHKEGALFVQAPENLLRQLIALRLHLDPCTADDGPLQVIPNTHTRGRISNAAALDLKAKSPPVACTAECGDVLALRPLLLHASAKAGGNSRRRVLHFVFGPRDLPYALRWQHAV